MSSAGESASRHVTRADLPASREDDAERQHQRHWHRCRHYLLHRKFPLILSLSKGRTE